MRPEVIIPRSVTPLVVLAILSAVAACMASTGFMACASRAPSVRPSIPACDSPSLMPAVACEGANNWRFDGCRWACRGWLDVPQLQVEWIILQINGVDVEVTR
jgi:curli biogenesis system outer membrane secretion channel CsgG